MYCYGHNINRIDLTLMMMSNASEVPRAGWVDHGGGGVLSGLGDRGGAAGHLDSECYQLGPNSFYIY